MSNGARFRCRIATTQAMSRPLTSVCATSATQSSRLPIATDVSLCITSLCCVIPCRHLSGPEVERRIVKQLCYVARCDTRPSLGCLVACVIRRSSVCGLTGGLKPLPTIYQCKFCLCLDVFVAVGLMIENVLWVPFGLSLVVARVNALCLPRSAKRLNSMTSELQG